MLADVLASCTALGETLLVACNTSFDGPGVRLVEDPGAGQGEAVAAGLRAAGSTPILVVNSDLPCAQPRDLLALLGALPAGGLALVAAADGTTNALALAAPHLFAPLYGPGSAERFLARAARLAAPAAIADIPNLVDDVDTLADVERLEDRLGPRTSAALEELRTGLPQ
jgi:2-phospho-L-lactate guanylyltransferase (CobY/MobA/RfbA family)